ncbi:hypothetical protein H5410_029960 [Solanum commersonii]|uniref:Uncharacterized protein n=1 Tax=Solanum commersonii TaxID=4109 RepID=A0A9J5YHW7_SOLCO|nr:hypothetical protein H5410_029960 [Solanum commersonii]
MKRIKGMTNNNNAEERMEFNDDMVEKIISHMALKSGVWREIQLRANTSISLSFYCPPVYWHNYLYWIKSDSSILGFDTKKEESILIDRPQFVDQFDLNYDFNEPKSKTKEVNSTLPARDAFRRG